MRKILTEKLKDREEHALFMEEVHEREHTINTEVKMGRPAGSSVAKAREIKQLKGATILGRCPQIHKTVRCHA
jgi:hypothetical protein